jgi:hypothetical protein
MTTSAPGQCPRPHRRESRVVDPLLRVAALVCCALAMGWFAVAMQPHWRQIRRAQALTRAIRMRLRALGTVALVVALSICLWVDHPSMAVLVWVMALAASAMSVAFTLAWRPEWLSWLVLWVRQDDRVPASRR